MKRIGGLLLVILGLAVASFGVFRAITAEDSTVVSVSVPGGQSQFIYTEPGVLSLAAETVTVTLSAPEGNVQWALATTKDAELYVGDASATKVVGLEAWDKAKVETLQGTEEARKAIEQAGHSDTGLDITHSDLWLKAGSGEKSVTAELTPDVTFEQSLIATTSTGTAPDLTLQWTRTVGVANPVPVIAMGVLIALIGTLLILNARQASKVRMSARRIRARRERSEAETSILPKYDDRADTNATTGGAYGAAIVPAANTELRERPLRGEDRLIIPVAEEAAAEGGGGESTPQAGKAEPEAPKTSQTRADQAEEEQDWRSLWSFSWGTPFQKGNDNA
ncbi:hypothetical protein [Trueperella pyogenes]|uniref:hypothetical protein n=1 Tax=Trueperella pyogenes TaxID=1661 RepID=UPI0006B2566C|nr:hypothetical protein [Trueperella pyogenes]ALD73073.1 hypothetical protein AN946_00315 [Trueperella pyogenes]